MRIKKIAYLPAALLCLALASCQTPGKGGENYFIQSYKDLAYGRDAKQKLDVYVPVGGEGRGVLLFVHGGAYVAGEKEGDLKWILPDIMYRDFVVVSMDYRLATLSGANRIKIKDMLDDIDSAKEYIESHAKDWRCDPGKLVIAGHSAGANLALLDAMARNEDGKIKGCLAISAPIDLADIDFLNQPFPQPGSTMKNKDAVRYLIDTNEGSAIEDDIDALKELSPLYLVDREGTSKGVRYFLAYGIKDDIIPPTQSPALQAELLKRGILSTLYCNEKEGHTFAQASSRKLVREKYLPFILDAFGGDAAQN